MKTFTLADMIRYAFKATVYPENDREGTFIGALGLGHYRYRMENYNLNIWEEEEEN